MSFEANSHPGWPLWFYRWTPGDVDCIAPLPVTAFANWDVYDCLDAMSRISKSSTPIMDTALYKVSDTTPLLSDDYRTKLAQLSLADLGEPLSPTTKLQHAFDGTPPSPSDRISLVFVDSVFIRWSILGSPAYSLPYVFVQPALGKQTIFQLLQAITQEKPVFAGHPVIKLYKDSDVTEEPDRRSPITTVFASSPFHKQLGIVVKLISRGADLRDWSPSDRLTKEPELHSRSPSEWTVSHYIGLQGLPNERIIDFRFPHLSGTGSHPDKDIPPIEILFQGFGCFLESWRAEYQPNFERAILTQDVKEDVDSFMVSMSEVYVDGAQRQSYGLAGLNNIFRRVFDPGEQITDAMISTLGGLVRPHGCYAFGPLQIPCCLIEFKNEGQSTPVPSVELVANYSRLVAAVGSKNKDVHATSRFPTLGITIIGPVVTMYALAYVGSVVCVPLTPGLFCLPSLCSIDRRAFHVAFAAATSLLSSIREHAASLMKVPLTLPAAWRATLPDINRLQSIDNFGYVHFTITAPLQKDLRSHVYKADGVVNGVPRLLVIKFVYSYGAAVHRECAELGFAPRLYAFDRLPGGIYAVAMDYMEGDTLDMVPVATRQQYGQTWATALRNFVTTIHARNYVHGDLRGPNIVCIQDRVSVLDFDWAGRIGEAFYPSRNLNPQIKECRDMRNLEITKDDDRHISEGTIRLCLPEVTS